MCVRRSLIYIRDNLWNKRFVVNSQTNTLLHSNGGEGKVVWLLRVIKHHTMKTYAKIFDALSLSQVLFDSIFWPSVSETAGFRIPVR
jgi:hypothetical protein